MDIKTLVKGEVERFVNYMSDRCEVGFTDVNLSFYTDQKNDKSQISVGEKDLDIRLNLAPIHKEASRFKNQKDYWAQATGDILWMVARAILKANGKTDETAAELVKSFLSLEVERARGPRMAV